MVITTNTTLDRDLLNCPHDGIVIGADNISLHLASHIIDGVRAFGSVGVRVGAHHGVTVSGPGTVREFHGGVLVGGTGGTPSVLADRVTGVTFSGNGAGIVVQSGRVSRFDHNVVTGNLGPGITLTFGANANRVDNNTVLSNGSIGISVGGAFFLVTGNVIDTNTVISNVAWGILVGAGGQNTLVSGNRALTNRSDGINVAGSGSIVRSNSALSNAGHGIVAGTGVTDGGGNLGLANKTPPQCVNVDCQFRFIFF